MLGLWKQAGLGLSEGSATFQPVKLLALPPPHPHAWSPTICRRLWPPAQLTGGTGRRSEAGRRVLAGYFPLPPQAGSISDRMSQLLSRGPLHTASLF